jgi:spermidine/putrescine transport system substrate-binding protein
MARRMDRRRFLASTAAAGGTVLISACGGGSSSGGGGSSAPAHPPIGKEPGTLSVYEWQGYEAAGTKAQTYMKVPGKSYVDEFGASTLNYTAFQSDDAAVAKVRAGAQYDLAHPCISYVRDWVDAGLVEPFDPGLLTNFSQLDPEVVKAGQVDGKQYWIPWDSGYSSVMYRKDMIAAEDATSWNLFWNPKYAGKISMWDGFTTPLVIAGLVNEQKQVNKFYWKLEYDDMQPAFKSGDIWVTYAWPNDYNDMLAAGLDTGYMDPSEGRLAWYCGFIMLKGTQNYFHNHKYVDSFIGHDACVDLFDAFVYASANTTVQKSDLTIKGPDHPKAYALPAAADALRIGDPNRLAAPVHLEQFIPQRAAYQAAWEEVKAS